MRASRALTPEPIWCATSQSAKRATASAAAVTMTRSRGESVPSQASASARSFRRRSILAPPRRRLAAGLETGERRVDGELELRVRRAPARAGGARVREAARGLEGAHDLVHVLGVLGRALQVQLVLGDLDPLEAERHV